MADTPQQDRKLRLPRTLVGGRFLTAYDPDIAMRIVEKVAEGELLIDICDPKNTDGFPHRTTFNRWVILFPELAKAYHAARQMSAMPFEEKALKLSEELRIDPGNGTKVRAYEVALNQLRWSASRRDPSQFGDKANVNIKVPVQIITALNLGQEGGALLEGKAENVYDLSAVVDVESSEVEQEDLTPIDIDGPMKRSPNAPRKRTLVPRIAMDAPLTKRHSKAKLIREPKINGKPE